MTTDLPVWFIVYHLFEIKHYALITPAMAKRLHRVDERLFQGECLGKVLKSTDSEETGRPAQRIVPHREN